MTDRRQLMTLMARQHGVATGAQARACGLSRRAEDAAMRDGSLVRVGPGVLGAGGSPVTFLSRAMAAALAPGVRATSHATAARLHGLDGFDRSDGIDVITSRSSNPAVTADVVVHRSRGLTADDLDQVAGIPTTTVTTTLALLAPAVGIGKTARALDSALRNGVSAEQLHATARRWRRRGRSGPAALLMLLGEHVDQRLPRSWFQRLASRVLASAGIRLVDEFPVRDRRGILLAELDLADPVRRVGVECQSWRWHATPTDQHRDARRRGMLRQLGWEVVDVWWSDLHHPDRVIAEVLYLLRTRTPTCPSDAARLGRL